MHKMHNKFGIHSDSTRLVRQKQYFEGFFSSEVLVSIYKAFILPHLEYCASVLVGLSSGLSNKLELTNQYAIRTLLNMGNSTSYSTLLDYVGLKKLEHRRYSYALCLFYKCLYNMGPNNIRVFISY